MYFILLILAFFIGAYIGFKVGEKKTENKIFYDLLYSSDTKLQKFISKVLECRDKIKGVKNESNSETQD